MSADSHPDIDDMLHKSEKSYRLDQNILDNVVSPFLTPRISEIMINSTIQKENANVGPHCLHTIHEQEEIDGLMAAQQREQEENHHTCRVVPDCFNGDQSQRGGVASRRMFSAINDKKNYTSNRELQRLNTLMSGGGGNNSEDGSITMRKFE